MFEFIDNFLNQITMYKLILYYLIILLVLAGLFGQFGILPYSPLALLFSVLVLTAACLAANKIFSVVVKVQTNVESAYITALILALIITPLQITHLYSTLPFLLWAAVWAMASKYILAIKHKHVFNPAAFAVALTALTIGQSASWWVGTSSMFIFVLIGGFLVIRKIQRQTMVYSFLGAALITSLVLSFNRTNPASLLYNAAIVSPLIFFAAVMLTEPLTTPPKKYGQIAYGILIGILFLPQIHFGNFYLTPELALIAGNLFSYAISPKGRYTLKLLAKEKASEGVYNFVFLPDKKVQFQPGQYLEWTLGHKRTDSRGNRRYFTIASSPTENEVILGVRFYDKPSSFKSKMLALNPGDTIMASQLAGDFTLPKDPNKKLVFIAGGIGITPFRSMLKYLIDKNEKRAVTTIYSSNSMDEIAYYDILEQAAEKIGAETIFTLTNQTKIDPRWQGYRGYVSAKMITEQIPDYKDRYFYISGPHTMVSACENVLSGLGVSKFQIKTDFFPGLV